MRSFSDHNPISVFGYYICVLVPAMFCPDPLFLAMAFLCGLAWCIIKRRGRLTSYLLYFIIPVIGLLANALLNHNGATVLFVINNSPVSLEAALYGLCAGLMISAVLIWFSSFSVIMTSDKLLYIFGSFSPKLALILSMTLRYIPLFRKQIRKVNNAQKCLGLYREYSTLDKLKKALSVFSVMTSWALENGVITADSMTARGYGCGKRSYFSVFSWRKSDILLICISFVLGAAVMTGLLLPGHSYEWYPYISAPETDALYIISAAAYLLLCLIPVVMQIKEDMRWRSLRSTI